MIRGTVGIWMLAFFENCITWIIKLRSVAISVLEITGPDSRLSFQWKHNLHLYIDLCCFHRRVLLMLSLLFKLAITIMSCDLSRRFPQVLSSLRNRRRCLRPISPTWFPHLTEWQGHSDTLPTMHSSISPRTHFLLRSTMAGWQWLLRDSKFFDSAAEVRCPSLNLQYQLVHVKLL